MKRSLILAMVIASLAGAVPVEASTSSDLAEAQKALPVDHPCATPARIALVRVDGLTVDGTRVLAHAPQGTRRPDGTWRNAGGPPIACSIEVDRRLWRGLSVCQRRRLLLHEVGHLAGRTHDEGGIMAPTIVARDRVALPGCPAVRPERRHRVVRRGDHFEST